MSKKAAPCGVETPPEARIRGEISCRCTAPCALPLTIASSMKPVTRRGSPSGLRASLVPGVVNSGSKSGATRRAVSANALLVSVPPEWQFPQRAERKFGLRPLRSVPKKMSSPSRRSPGVTSRGTLRLNPSTCVRQGWRLRGVVLLQPGSWPTNPRKACGLASRNRSNGVSSEISKSTYACSPSPANRLKFASICVNWLRSAGAAAPLVITSTKPSKGSQPLGVSTPCTALVHGAAKPVRCCPAFCHRVGK